MTAIPIRPPVFPKKEQAIDYAQNRACFRSSEIQIFDSTGKVERTMRSTTQIESCDAVIRAYDEAGSVIQTHENKRRFQRVVVPQ